MFASDCFFNDFTFPLEIEFHRAELVLKSFSCLWFGFASLMATTDQRTIIWIIEEVIKGM